MKKIGKDTKKFTKSIEKLTHFNCNHCDKWWTIGDAPTARKKWYCPWCGKSEI